MLHIFLLQTIHNDECRHHLRHLSDRIQSMVVTHWRFSSTHRRQRPEVMDVESGKQIVFVPTRLQDEEDRAGGAAYLEESPLELVSMPRAAQAAR